MFGAPLGPDCPPKVSLERPSRETLRSPQGKGLLGGSWVVIGGVMRPLVWVITIVTLLITQLITTYEPASREYPSIGNSAMARASVYQNV